MSAYYRYIIIIIIVYQYDYNDYPRAIHRQNSSKFPRSFKVGRAKVIFERILGIAVPRPVETRWDSSLQAAIVLADVWDRLPSVLGVMATGYSEQSSSSVASFHSDPYYQIYTQSPSIPANQPVSDRPDSLEEAHFE